MRVLKKTSFGLMAIILVVLAVGTILQKIDSSAVAAYTSPWFVALWTVMAVSAVAYMLRSRLYRRLPAFAVHASFAVILAGALTSWLTSEHGTLRLKDGAEASAFTLDDGSVAKMPFSLKLQRFEIEYYAGTEAPMDFVSHLSADGVNGTASMNNVFSHRGYRFYQSGYDSEGGSVFTVAHDPMGIGVTYAGYALLLASICWFMMSRKSRFRSLLRKLSAKPLAVVGALMVAMSAQASDLPSLPQQQAEEMGNLYVLYGDRICPLQTMAKEFTEKLCGNATFDGLSAEQVLSGWLYYPTDWSKVPMIKIKSAEVRRLLGIDGKYASVRDFFSDVNEYKLEKPLRGIDRFADPQGLREAAEKFDIINRLTTGKSLKIFPLKDAEGKIGWFSQGDDNIPVETDTKEWMFVKMSLSYANELVQTGRWADLSDFYAKVRKYQIKNGGATLPSDTRFKAEKTYNTVSNARPLAITLMCVGLVAFFSFCLLSARGGRPRRWAVLTLRAIAVAAWLYISVIIVLLWFVSGHIPMSNGYETMLFLAWCAVPIAMLAERRMPLALPMGVLLCGMTTMVAMMGFSNPRMSQLMPVLQSPLLSAHVAVIMVAYALLAFMAMNGIAAFVMRMRNRAATDEITALKEHSELLLYPAVMLLTIGIFLGAVWANVSWGRYWGWDPKEVWALITMIVYAFAFHRESFPWLRRPMAFHAYMVLAFFSVLFTYFGVNFFLTGMHSYA